jgi:hypothetical protein
VPDLIERYNQENDYVGQIFSQEYRKYSQEDKGNRELRIRGTLSQTRPAGTPPQVVYLRSRLKFLKTVTDKPEPMTSGQRRLIQLGIREMIESLPDPPFTGLSTKAGVRISTSACYEYTRLEGGSSQAIHDIVSEGNLGRKVKILDLETGNVLDQKELSDLTHGEYIFWRCLEVVLGTPLKELGKVFLVTAKEPGKARTVTKAHTAVKCVLDVVNGICSWPLSKGFRSSSSGMLKESHGWNFFKELFSFEEMLFKIKNSQKEHIGPTTFIETLWYQDVYVSSTDYETATD